MMTFLVFLIIISASNLVFSGAFIALIFRFREEREHNKSMLEDFKKRLNNTKKDHSESLQRFEETARAASKANESQMTYIKAVEERINSISSKMALQRTHL